MCRGGTGSSVDQVRSRVRKVSWSYRSQSVRELPELHMTRDDQRERATGIEPAFSAWEAHQLQFQRPVPASLLVRP